MEALWRLCMRLYLRLYGGLYLVLVGVLVFVPLRRSLEPTGAPRRQRGADL